MILVSFHSEENALSHAIKITFILYSQSIENRLSAFCGTPGILKWTKYFDKQSIYEKLLLHRTYPLGLYTSKFS